MKKTALKKRTILLALLLLCMAVGLGGTCLAEEGAGSADPLRGRTNEGDRTKSRGTEKPWFPACTAPGTTVSFRAPGPVRPGPSAWGAHFCRGKSRQARYSANISHKDSRKSAMGMSTESIRVNRTMQKMRLAVM